MRFDPRLFRWGVFFITLGAVPLAVRANLIDSDTVVQGWRLWPLLLVGLGVSILLRGTRVELLGGSFTVNAGSIRFCTPADAALRLSTSEHLTASYDFGSSGLVKDGSTWTSPNYASAAVRIDLSTTANAGSIALNPKDGCR